jgi:hypothetical protein
MPTGGKQIRIPDDVRQRVIMIYEEGEKNKSIFSERTIAEMTGISRGGVRAILARAGKVDYFNPDNVKEIMSLVNAGLEVKEVSEKTGYPVSTVFTVMYYYREREKLNPAPDLVKQIVNERIAISKQWKPGRYVIIADLHICFHNRQIIEQLLTLKGDYSGCIIAGDFLDELWISRFRKDMRITHQEEAAAGLSLINLLVKKFGRVAYLLGNHEERRWKQLLEAVKPVADLAGDKASILYKAIQEVRNWYYGEKVVHGITMHNGWFLDICGGKQIVCHSDRFMKIPGNSAREVTEHLLNHQRPYRLNMPFNGLWMAHTHRLSGIQKRLGVWVCELPCMTGVLPYQVASKASSSGTVDTGFFILTTYPNGEFWFNESKIVLLEEDVDDEQKKMRQLVRKSE